MFYLLRVRCELGGNLVVLQLGHDVVVVISLSNGVHWNMNCLQLLEEGTTEIVLILRSCDHEPRPLLTEMKCCIELLDPKTNLSGT